MKSIKNILVTTDFSKDSDLAVEQAALLARKFHSTLYLLDVVERIYQDTPDCIMPYEVVMGERDKLLEDVRKKMKKKAVELEARYQIKAVADVRYGETYNEIMKEEAEKKIDLIVIAPHKRKKFIGNLFTHLSDKVAKNSCCDTLLVRQ